MESKKTIPFDQFKRLPSDYVNEPTEGYYDVDEIGRVFLSSVEVLAMQNPEFKAFVMERVRIMGGDPSVLAPWRVAGVVKA